MPSERIQLLIDVVTGNSRSQLSQLRTDFKNADGAAAKMKVTGSALGDALKQNVALGASAAAGAIATLAVKGVGDFQKVALGAGQLASSLGITTQEASRLQETAADLGIGVSTVERGIGRMNREAANSPEKFAAIGAEIAHTASGATDVTQTFLNVIEALRDIEDPAERAAAAQEILGRGWQDLSRIIALGADDLTARLASVEDAKIMTPEQVAQAEEFRDTLDELRGVGESLSLTFGGTLVPVLTDTAQTMQELGSALQFLKGGFETFTSLPLAKQIYENLAPWEQWRTRIDQARGAYDKLTDTFGGKTHGTFDPTELNEYNDTLTRTGIAMAQAAADAERLSAANEAITDPQIRKNAQEHADMLYLEAQAAQDTAANMESMRRSVELKRAADERAAEAAREHAEALQEEGEAAKEQADAFRAASDASFALRDAQRQATESGLDLNDAQVELGEVMEDGEASDADRARALLAVADAQDNVLTSADAVADAEVRLREERAASRGATVSATAALDTFNHSLVEQAAQASGPTRQAIVNHIAELNNIPPKKASEILADIDEGRLQAAEAKLNNTSRSRRQTTTADASTGAAEAELASLTRPREVLIFPRVGGPIPRFQGGGHTSGGLAITHPGESFTPDSGGGTLSLLPAGTVHTASRTRGLLAGSAAAGAHADDLLRQAAALRELARSAKNAADAEELRRQAEDLGEKADKALAHSQELAAAAMERLGNAAGKEADKLRRHAEALRDDARAALEAGRNRADALTEQSVSYRQAYDAERQLLDAQEQQADAQKQLREAGRQETRGGITTFVHTEEERADALERARDAALAMADAEVQLARERAESRGRRFTDLDAITEQREALLRMGRRDLIGQLNLGEQARLLRQGGRVLTGAREEAADLRQTARHTDKAAKHLEGIERGFGRLANGIERVLAVAVRREGALSEREIRQVIRRALDGVA